jgi:hypothetical protein
MYSPGRAVGGEGRFEIGGSGGEAHEARRARAGIRKNRSGGFDSDMVKLKRDPGEDVEVWGSTGIGGAWCGGAWDSSSTSF